MHPVEIIQEGIGGFGGWGFPFTRLVKNGKFSLNDFERLDFSLPGDAEYGDNPAFEFFNPQSIFHVRPYSEYLPHFIDQATTVATPRVIVNLRRSVRPDGRTLDALYAIVPNIKKDKCLRIQSLGSLKIEKNNSVVVEDKSFLKSGCVAEEKTPDRVYLFVPFFSRHRQTATDNWSIE